MRFSLTIPAACLTILVAACAGAPPTNQQATATGTHIAGVTTSAPTNTVGQDELNRLPSDSTTNALAHSTASPFLSGR
jgi:hypothetical protein